MASIEYVVNAVDNASGTFRRIAVSTDDLKRQLDDLSRKVATPKIDVNDKQAQLKLAEAATRINRLSKQVADPKVELDTTRFQRDLLRVDAELDKLSKKTVDVGGGGIFRRIRGLFGGGGGEAAAAAGNAGQGIGGALSALGPYGQGALIGGGVGTAAALGPAVLPFALGTGLGGLGAYLAGGGKITKDLSSFMATIKTDVAPLKPLFDTVFDSLTKFAKSLGPGLRDVFAESVPFLKSFLSLLGPIAKILLPAFSETIRNFIPYLPQFNQGILRIVKGFAGLLTALGPQGMQDATKIFITATKVIEFALIALGKTMNALAVGIIKGVHDIATWWDWMRHHTATVFDGMRHDIAHYWDMIYNNSIGVVIRFGHNVETQFNSLRHGIATTYDGIRHDIASIWDTIWNNTIGQVRNGVGTVIRWIGGLPGKIEHVFSGAINWLYGAGKDVIQGLWNGLLFIWHKVTGFISGIANWIKQHKGPVSLDAKLLEPAGRALMNGLLSGLTSGFGDVANFIGGVTGKIGSFLSGPHGSLQNYAKNLLDALGWGPQWAAFNDIVMRESGWNVTATNPSSGAYGIPQALPGSKMASAGADWRTNGFTQLRWMMAYIKSVYGDPLRADLHERMFHWYGSGLAGGIFSRPTIIGVGERGPERVDVTPIGGRRTSGPLVHVDTMVVQDATDATLVARQLSFAITTSNFG